MRTVGFALMILFALNSQAQDKRPVGIIIGNVLDSVSHKAIVGATIQLTDINTNTQNSIVADKNGAFSFTDLPFGYYRLSITAAGLSTLRIDSIHIREERFDFNIGDIMMSANAKELETVIIYAEKPLIESKDGNITFNAGESALAAGSNASELLNNVPLVTKDPNGAILVRGKEPKILIDDKPVELNLQQLQDLLESMPGNSIEKIEVMTNPPPQYANEQGGVINIVTRKGRVGKGGRLSVSAGTRGEYSISGNFSYRKNKFAINVNAGAGYNLYEGNGYSTRKNIYTDSTNFFNTQSNYRNKNFRPNLRVTMDYDISKKQALNFVANYNQNNFENINTTEYTNINRFDEIYRLSERTIQSDGDNYNGNLNLTYTLRGKKQGEQFRVITGLNNSESLNSRLFYQQFFNPDHTSNGTDSTQEQVTDNSSIGYNIRLSYDNPITSKTSISTGATYNMNQSHIVVDASYLKKPDGQFVDLALLSNNFKFRQEVLNGRFSVKQILGENFSVTMGINAEQTDIGFDLLKENRSVSNDYWSFLPFGNINKNWKEKLNVTFSYRRTIRRPGVYQLNPTIDFSDPYNIRFGNYQLSPSLAHNFDLVLGRTNSKYFTNLGFGYNLVEDIFSQVRTLQSDGKTQVTWENISDRKEYEVSTWNGYTVNKQLKINLNASYTYNVYSEFDRTVKKYRNGGSFTSSLNGNYNVRDQWSLTASFRANRFSNPQGSVNWNLGVNLGFQYKMLNKRLTFSLNVIDPFRNQQNESYTYGTNFELYSFSSTQSKNYRFTLSYNLTKPVKKMTPVKGNPAIKK